MARTEGKWQKKGTFLIPNDNVPVVLRNNYLNFGGITAGDLGFGIRNEDGVIQFKNSAGAWTDMGGGGGLPDQTGNNGRFLTTNGAVASWATISGGGDLLASNNLSDVANAGTARTNLGLGTAAQSAAGDFATAAQGTLAASASQPGHTHVAANITDFASAVAATASVTANTAKNTYPSGDATKVGHITVTQAVNLDTMESDIAALEQAVVLKGLWDASAGTFPGGGTAQAGFSYIVSVGGTVDSVVFTANDRLVAILDNASTTTYASNWHKLDYTDAVLSVAGRTGAVVLVKGDVGLGSVDDTADTAKPVSTAQQTALNLKANLASPTFTGTVVLPSGQALIAPALGTPASGVATNLTGLPAASVLAGSLGTGAYVMDSSLQVETIELGHATDTTLSRLAAAEIAVEGVRIKTTTPKLVSADSYTTDTGTSLNMDNLDQFIVTAQAGALLFNAPGGTLVQGRSLVIRIKDNANARALTWDAVFRAMGTALPSTTVLSKTLYLGFFYNSTDTKWDLVASAQEA